MSKIQKRLGSPRSPVRCRRLGAIRGGALARLPEVATQTVERYRRETGGRPSGTV
jgi:hypothetical protein